MRSVRFRLSRAGSLRLSAVGAHRRGASLPEMRPQAILRNDRTDYQGKADPVRSDRSSGRHDRRLSAFGLEIDADFPLPGAYAPGSSSSEHKLALTLVSRAELSPLAGKERVLRYLHVFEGCPYAMLESRAGDILFHYGARALFHLSADGDVLRCAPAAGNDFAWQRVLLDTVLWTVSLLRGFELLHASAVETAAGVIAFVAISGGGKTSLAAECLRRGALLFCDDILALDDRDGQVVGYPGPPLVNLPLTVRAESLGTAHVIGYFADEQWVQIAVPPRPAQPLAAVVLVHRTAGERSQCSRIDATNLTLLPHAVGFPHLEQRAKRRFELFGLLASTTPVLRVSADPSIPPTDLVDLVEERIALR